MKSADNLFLVVGLGNPGAKYAFTRHNVGFMACDVWLKSLGDDQMKSEHKALVKKMKLKNGDKEAEVIVAKPQTYMNLSGESVVSLMQFYKIPKTNLLVVHDDIDQPFGGMKLQYNRGHGGQNGVRNISELSGGADYHRLKIGVGRPAHPEFSVADYVLSGFSKEEQQSLMEILEKSIGAIESFIWNGPSITATKFNT